MGNGSRIDDDHDQGGSQEFCSMGRPMGIFGSDPSTLSLLSWLGVGCRCSQSVSVPGSSCVSKSPCQGGEKRSADFFRFRRTRSAGRSSRANRHSQENEETDGTRTVREERCSTNRTQTSRSFTFCPYDHQHTRYRTLRYRRL